MIQTLTLNGGIDKDTNPLYLAEGSVLSRKNCRVASFDGGRVGINVSLKGMQEIEANLPSGTNRVIGQVEDAERDQLIFANYNSNGNHGIYKLKDDVVTALSVASFWNFNQNYPADMDVLGDYVYITDNINPPRKVSLTTSLSGADSYDVQLAVRYPTDAPVVNFGSDTSKKTNKMLGKAFQFAYLYIYTDNTYSVLSPYSDIIVSPSVFNYDGTIVNSSLGNYVTISFNVGSDDVKQVILLAKEQNFGNWFVVKRYDKNGEDEFSTASVDFYNDVARVGNPYPSAENYNGNVPRLAKTIATAGNRIELGNVLRGYDQPEVDFSVAVEYEDVDLGNFSEALANSDTVGTDAVSNYSVQWVIPSDIQAGDVISVSLSGTYKIDGSTAYDFDFSYSHSVVVGEGDTVSDVLLAFAYDILSKRIITEERATSLPNSSIGPEIEESTREVKIVFYGVVFSGFTVENSYSGSFSRQSLTSGVNTYKAGSYYNVSLVDCDEFSRTAGAVGTQIVYIPYSFERDFADAYKSAVLKFTINDSSAPSWSKNYKFAVTESISFSGVFNMLIGGDVIATTVDDKRVIAIGVPTNVNYAFVNGDYAIIETSDGTSLQAVQKTVIGTRTLITNEADEEVAGFWLLIPDEGEAIEDTLGTILTVYRPKDSVENNLFFEDFNTYDVIGGVRQTLTGYIRTGDAWISNRWFNVSNADRIDCSITLDTGSSGTVELGLNLGAGGTISKVATFDTSYAVTARNFVSENSSYFWANGVVLGVDGDVIYFIDAANDAFIYVPYVNTLTGDISGTGNGVPADNSNILHPSTVEDFYIELATGLRSYSKGRVIVEFDELGEIRLQDVMWSNTYLDNTKINGVSFFESLNRIQLDEKDGQLNKLILVGDVLKAIQDNKETSLYIGKEQITNANGSLQLVKTGNFIGTVYPSVDDYGSRYHDSVVKNNRNMYYWDGDKGEVVRSSPNGQISISNYGMRSEFQRIADDIKSASSVRVISGFDEKHNDFIITFSIDGVNQTLVFRDGDNMWINDDIEYENASGKAPDLYGSIGNQLYSFLDNAWKHEATSSYNTFYGDSKTLSVRGLLNMSPTDQKALRSLKIDSNRAPNVIIETPVTNTRPLGQKTVLYPATFRSRLGEFVSAVFKNILTVSGEDINLIHSNDDIVGFFIELEFTDSGTTEFQLRTVDTTFTINR